MRPAQAREGPAGAAGVEALRWPTMNQDVCGGTPVAWRYSQASRKTLLMSRQSETTPDTAFSRYVPGARRRLRRASSRNAAS